MNLDERTKISESLDELKMRRARAPNDQLRQIRNSYNTVCLCGHICDERPYFSILQWIWMSVSECELGDMMLEEIHEIYKVVYACENTGEGHPQPDLRTLQRVQKDVLTLYRDRKSFGDEASDYVLDDAYHRMLDYLCDRRDERGDFVP